LGPTQIHAVISVLKRQTQAFSLSQHRHLSLTKNLTSVSSEQLNHELINYIKHLLQDSLVLYSPLNRFISNPKPILNVQIIQSFRHNAYFMSELVDVIEDIRQVNRAVLWLPTIRDLLYGDIPRILRHL